MEQRGWFDADAHVIEPPTAWTAYTPTRFHDRVPRLERRDGADWMMGADGPLFSIGRMAGLARREGRLRLDGNDLAGTWEHDILEGAWSPDARLADMAHDGVGRALLFPTVGMSFFALTDDELRWAMLEAFNRWVSDHCSAGGPALTSVCMVDPSDPERAAREARRGRDRGQAALLVPLWDVGGEQYGDPALDTLWATAADLGMPVGFHAFSARTTTAVRPDRNLAVEAVAARPSVVVGAITELLFSGVFERVPGLRWFSAENDAGWCPYLVERADHLYERAASSFPITRRPSELFHEHVFVTFTWERGPVAALDTIGHDNLLWGSDYPHNASTWPSSRPFVEGIFDDLGIGPDTRERLTVTNAARLFG